MVPIDLNRLRKYHSDAAVAHSNLLAAWSQVRQARAQLSRARDFLARFEEPAPGLKRDLGISKNDYRRAAEEAAKRNERQQAEALQAVADAEEAVVYAEAERDRLEAFWAHASRLKTSVRNYAIACGALPHDLRDEHASPSSSDVTAANAQWQQTRTGGTR